MSRHLCRHHHRRRQPDQGRDRDGDPERGQQLYRRHDGRRGTLQGNTSSLKGNIVAAGGADVTFNQATAGIYAGVLSGNGRLTKIGAGILTLSGNSSYQGGTEVTGGGLSISSDANLGNGGTVALGANTSLEFTAGGTYTHAITVRAIRPSSSGSGVSVTQTGAIDDGGGRRASSR